MNISSKGVWLLRPQITKEIQMEHTCQITGCETVGTRTSVACDDTVSSNKTQFFKYFYINIFVNILQLYFTVYIQVLTYLGIKLQR